MDTNFLIELKQNYSTLVDKRNELNKLVISESISQKDPGKKMYVLQLGQSVLSSATLSGRYLQFGPLDPYIFTDRKKAESALKKMETHLSVTPEILSLTDWWERIGNNRYAETITAMEDGIKMLEDML